MNWNIFSPVKKVGKRGKAKDAFDKLIDIIETFAPKESLSEREAFYYNYKMMPTSGKSLPALLETVSQVIRLTADPEGHTRELFLKLKDFYDPGEKLSLPEALADRNLMKKLRDLYVFFYGRKSLSREEIAERLETLKID